MYWEAQTGRFPRDPRLGHRPGRSYRPTEKQRNKLLPDLYTTSDGFISNSNSCEHSGINLGSNIVVIGGSTAMGLGASSNSKTISANLDQSSVIRNASYKVVNAACSAYCSWQELIRFALEISRFEPPIVISISSYNDFYHASIGDRFTGEWYLNHDRSIDDLSNYLIGLNETVSLRSIIKNKLLQQEFIKYLYTLYMNTVKLKNLDQDEVRWGYADVVFSDRENSASNYLHNMSLINALVSSYGGYFVNIQQPILALVSQRIPTDDYSRLVALHPGLDKALHNFYQRISDIKTSHKLFSFSEFDASHFVDHCHLNDVGQALMAKLILKTVEPYLLKMQ